MEAALQAGRDAIEADVREGSVRDARLYACGANASHGLRRTNADKRKAVMTLLEDEEWGGLSDNQIADKCGVSQPFVSHMRKSLITDISDTSPTRTYTDRYGNVTTMDTSRIGRTEGSAAVADEPELPLDDEPVAFP